MFVSPLVAVRDALRKTQSEDMRNEYEEDFVQWAYEAEKKILNNTFSLGEWKKTMFAEGIVWNNQFQLPDDFYTLVCLKVGNEYPALINTSVCRLVRNCANCYNYKYLGKSMTINGYCVTFTPANIPDGTKVEVQYQSLRLDTEDGYPMIFEDHWSAVSEYIQWQILSNFKNDINKAELKRRDWMLSCPQARARTANLTATEMAALGNVWWI